MARVVRFRGAASSNANEGLSQTQANYALNGSFGSTSIVTATCNAAVNVGDVVRFNGTEFVTASSANATTAKIVGVCVAKPGATTCDIATAGTTGQILSGLTPNTTYFLNSSGGLTTTPPSGPGEAVAQVGVSISSTELIVLITSPLIRA